MRVLVAGWFSFDEVIATVGDELGADAVVRWLTERGVPHDVAEAPYLGTGVHWRDVDPGRYTHLVFVSGPVRDTPLLRDLCATFASCRRLAVNVSVVTEAGRALFDDVWERDAPGLARPDLAVDSPAPSSPVLAVAFTPPQAEYGDRSCAERARGVVEEWLADRQLPWFELDMDLYTKPYRRRPVQVEALVRRADAVVSMRLHALALGLKHDRPVIACDPVAGGAKVAAQARALGWPLVLHGDTVTAADLDAALTRALAGGLAGELAGARTAGRRGNDRARAWLTERLGG